MKWWIPACAAWRLPRPSVAYSSKGCGQRASTKLNLDYNLNFWLTKAEVPKDQIVSMTCHVISTNASIMHLEFVTEDSKRGFQAFMRSGKQTWRISGEDAGKAKTESDLSADEPLSPCRPCRWGQSFLWRNRGMERWAGWPRSPLPLDDGEIGVIAHQTRLLSPNIVGTITKIPQGQEPSHGGEVAPPQLPPALWFLTCDRRPPSTHDPARVQRRYRLCLDALRWHAVTLGRMIWFIKLPCALISRRQDRSFAMRS